MDNSLDTLFLCISVGLTLALYAVMFLCRYYTSKIKLSPNLPDKEFLKKAIEHINLFKTFTLICMIHSVLFIVFHIVWIIIASPFYFLMLPSWILAFFFSYTYFKKNSKREKEIKLIIYIMEHHKKV